MAEVADDLERAAENERAPADKREDALKRAGTGKQAHVEGPIPWAEMTNVQRAHHVKTEVLLGIIITFAQVPESVAFAFLAHVRPPIALHAAWVVGLICGVFGGRPGMINGATGAFAAIIATFLPPPSVPGGNGEGIELLFPSVILAGVLMGLVWLLRGARYITLIPESVMVGFCNGLAIVIGNAQLHPFREGHGPDAHWKSGAELGFMLFIMVVAMVTMEYVPKIPCAYARLVPSSLISIGCSIVIEFGLGRPLGFRTDTIGDVAQFTSDSVFPMPFMLDPQYDLSRLWAPDALSTVLQQGVMLCLVGVIESLLTTEVVTELVKTPADSAAVVWSMGLANVVSGTLGGMGGNAMIGLSTINGLNGGTGRIAPVTTALCIMVCIVGAYPLLNLIPVSALAGVMLVVVFHTFRWGSLAYMLSALLPSDEQRAQLRLGARALPLGVDRYDAVIMAAVTLVTVATNLVYAVLAGVVLAAVRYAWRASQQLELDALVLPDGTKQYTAKGDVFFATAMRFHAHFDVDDDPPSVELLLDRPASDYSGTVALEKLRATYAKRGKELVVRHSLDPLHLAHPPLYRA